MSTESLNETNPTPLLDEALSIATELTRKLTLNGGQVPATAEAFWRIIGATMSLAVPEGTSVNMARAVLEHLGETWDDDYEDNGRLSQDAYEALMGRILDRERGDEDDDDDDDATGGLAAESAKILVSSRDLAVTTIIQWVEDNTLVLDPLWQRAYVWKAPRKRRFIESIFMALPIPPVLLFQDKDSKLYVIDGRQRLETIYRFSLGSRDKKRSFTTFGKKTPGWEDGQALSDAAGKRFDKLPQDIQRRFSTFSVPARVFMNLERRTLYEVFKRYNTGGDKLNPAEIRNAVYQRIPLHDMIYKLAGEMKGDQSDQDESKVAAKLRTIMKGKVQRYGCYNFIGRVLAFAHVKGGSVANAINKLMSEYGDGDVELLRREFIRSFNKTLDWYPAPLAAEQSSGKTPFHEWVATIQMVSTTKALQWIDEGRTTEEKVQDIIERKWTTFVQGTFDQSKNEYVGGVLQEKQNTTTHWDRQSEWIKLIENECCDALTQ